MSAVRVLELGQVPLVLGLDWIPLLGETDAVDVLARRQGASHRVISGEPPAAVGLGKNLPRRQQCWSAAALHARQHTRGTVATVLQLDDQCWHVLASHEGAALARADRSYPDPELARHALETLRQSYPQMKVYFADESLLRSKEELASLARLAADSMPMRPVRHLARYGYGLMAAGLLAIAFYAWLGATSVPPESTDAHQAWNAVLQRALEARPVHGPDGTRALLLGLYRQPARIAGWLLHDVRCEISAGTRYWQCLAEYRREDLQADNRGLLQAAPPLWQIDFPSLDRARAVWRMPVPARKVRAEDLRSSTLLSRDWASELQAVLPAFTSIRLEEARPLALDQPHDAKGQIIPQPADLSLPRLRSLQVEGPLRSAMLLTPLSRPVSWHGAVLRFAAGTRPDIRHSRLVLFLEGSVYERDE